MKEPIEVPTRQQRDQQQQRDRQRQIHRAFYARDSAWTTPQRQFHYAAAPTRRQLHSGVGLETVMSTSFGDILGGIDAIEILYRESDDTYWQAEYFISDKAPTPGLLRSWYSGLISIWQVRLVQTGAEEYRHAGPMKKLLAEH